MSINNEKKELANKVRTKSKEFESLLKKAKGLNLKVICLFSSLPVSIEVEVLEEKRY